MDVKLKKENPLIISGPCSAESRDQLFRTVEAVAADIDIIRAGIWKPRTRPGSFEGVGEKGLEWLVDAGRTFGLPVTTEVASASHVRLALQYGIDVLWIGARTTVSPFAVQEIADSLKGLKDVKVMIKNPVNPDIELWAGSIQRILGSGVKRENIAMIHRGFSSYGKHQYRNLPMWGIPLEMKRRFPDIPMICDPSHITGDAALVREISQMAANLRFDGLMIESHICPESALSDNKQQLTPENLHTMLAAIVWRAGHADDGEYINKLKGYRSEIDEVDCALVDLLARRMEISDRIGEIKRKNNVAVLQQERWADLVQNALGRATAQGLSEELVSKVLEAVHIESIQRQNRILDNSIEKNPSE